MVNYAGGFNQSETGKYFKLIIMFIIQANPNPASYIVFLKFIVRGPHLYQ